MPSPTHTELIVAKLRSGTASAAELAEALGISQSSVSRALRGLIQQNTVLQMGSTRGARYGMRRDIPGAGSHWPLRCVDEYGAIHEMGTLYALARDQYFFDPVPAALAAGFAWGGLSDGIPYFLQDQRPGGFLGRAVPRRYPELTLPQRVIDWTDDHYLRYLTQRGSDTVGNLILGAVAFDQYLAGLRQQQTLPANKRSTRYPQFATEVMEGGLPGSSAHGEHPKFAASIQEKFGERPVLVKFSPPVGTAVGQRWSDLLLAEHHAHRVLRDADVPACESRIEQFADRTYLQIDRFDRRGAQGRVGVSSLLAIDTAQYGALDNWIASANRLHGEKRIDAQTLEQVRLVSTFGALIANTDRHFGNLAFYDNYDGQFQLAPVYDMLPMLFAPEHDQIVQRTFTPAHPASDTLKAWPRARALAEEYWRVLIAEPRISAGFKKLCAVCLQAIEALPRTGAYVNI